MKKSKETLKTYKASSTVQIHILHESQEEEIERNSESESLYENIMTENVSMVHKKLHIHIQETQ